MMDQPIRIVRKDGRSSSPKCDVAGCDVPGRRTCAHDLTPFRVPWMTALRAPRSRRDRRPTPRRIVASACLGMAMAGGVGAQAGGLSEPVRQQLGAILADKASRSPVERKIGSDLLYELKRQRRDPLFHLVPALQPRVPRAKSAHIEVDVQASLTGRLLHLVESVGGVVVAVHPRERAARIRVPLSALEEIAALDEVVALHRGETPLTQKVDTTEGDVAHGADDARQAFGVDGTGVKVGVLSDGVDSLGNLQASGDLPAGVVVLPGQAGTGSEGTAMLEIIHDLAPGAQLYFATAKPDRAQFAQNIRDLADAGCDVIVDDVSYPTSPVFQDGIVAAAVEEVAAEGVLYFSAAGDGGNANDGTSGTWEGDYVDSGEVVHLVPEDGSNGDGVLHDFGGSLMNAVTTTAPNGVMLQWSDPVDASDNDYDLCLLDADGTTVLACSTNWQEGPGDHPYERLDLPVEAGSLVVVINFDGLADARYFHLTTVGGGALALATPGNIFGQQAASSAFAVAAVDVATAAGDVFLGGAENPVETFSADGPRRIFYSATGDPITPGDLSSTGGALRQKPDVTAADGVSTATPGFNPFTGTSAAAAHAAGLAALMKELDPTLTPERARAVFSETALDIEAPGADRDSGYGIIMAEALLAAFASPCGSPSAPASFQTSNPAPVSGESYVLAWSAVTDADSYELQEATDAAFSGPVTFTFTGTSTSFTRSVESSTTYYYRVRALKDCGASSTWAGPLVVTVSPASCAAPGTPSGLSSNPSSPTGGETYTLSWTAAPDADSYQIEEATDPSFTDPESSTVSGTSTTYSHDVAQTTTYYYRVRAVRDCGASSAWSGPLPVTVSPASCAAPGTPSGLFSNPTSPTSGEAYALSWTAVSDADSYQIEEATDPSFADAESKAVSGTSTAYSHSVAEATIYYYRVRASRSCGSVSPWTSTTQVQVVVAGCAPPEQPQNFHSSADVAGVGETYTLTWDWSAGADAHELQESADPEFSAPTTYLHSSNTTQDLVKTEATPSTFYYRVRGTKECGSQSPWTAVIQVTIATEDCLPPDMPAGVAPTTPMADSGEPYHIQWTEASDAEYYEITEARTADFSGTKITMDIRGTEWHRSHSVAETTTFYYRVRSVRDCSGDSVTSPWTAPVSITVYAEGERPTFVYLVPGVAHMPGARGTNWRCNLSVLNTIDATVALELTFRDADGSTVRPAAVGPFGTVEWEDVALSLFDMSGPCAGAVEISSNLPVIVSARSYNASAEGTYGQYLPGCELADTLSSGQVGYLPQLKSTEGFRTNIGVVNLGDVPCTASITLHSDSGAQLGDGLSLEVAPGGWFQENDVFAKAQAGACGLARARIELETPGCSIWAYASVVDNATGDPTTIPLFVR